MRFLGAKAKDKATKRAGYCASRKIPLIKSDARQQLVKATNARGATSQIAQIRAAYLCVQCDLWHLTRSLPHSPHYDRERHMLAADALTVVVRRFSSPVAFLSTAPNIVRHIGH